MKVRITNVDHSNCLAKVEILWARGLRSYPFKFHYVTSNQYLEYYINI